ncbi:MAG TPA: hypothetical protein PKK95_07345 [Vicinamibacterales bacterium]|nr:hypothetical protein [Acidobacteriota bacterium]HOC18065.1 hypothetical protein [Vicinamibacterales bacterium]
MSTRTPAPWTPYAALIAALALLATLPASPAAAPGQLGLEAREVPGRPSDAHRRLFTPRAAPPGAYIVTVLASPMKGAREEVMSALGVAEPGHPPSPPADAPWGVRRLEVAEAFGASGPYEPIRVARLFNGRRVEVSRGPVMRHGRPIASVTLISPYPDATLSRIEPGTLVIVLRLGPAAGM